LPVVDAPADLIIVGARIYTVDDARPIAEAMAIKGGKVIFVGSLRGAMALKGANTKVADYSGRTIVPGITDAHAHMLGLGIALSSVDLVGTKSYDEVIARVVARAKNAPAGSWITGRGWDQNHWGDTRFPTQEKLSAAVPDHPVVLERVDGHAVLANAMAIKAANVTAATKDPDGGRIERAAGSARPRYRPRSPRRTAGGSPGSTTPANRARRSISTRRSRRPASSRCGPMS
jgi:predicted amidohydrolase YtcJ